MHATLETVLGGLLLVGVALGSACSNDPSNPSDPSALSDLSDRSDPLDPPDRSEPPAARDAAVGVITDVGKPARSDDRHTLPPSRVAATDRVDAAADGGATSPIGLRLPPANALLDYQLGGAYAPPDGVAVVSRDRQEQPAPGLYNVCYVNGFQSQTEDEDFWLDEHAQLVLRDEAGRPVIDPDWDEMLLDIRTPESRAGLLAIVAPWIEGCARAGFAAVEIDNLDSYARSGSRITEAQAVLFMRLLADTAHASGLAIAQKNAAELLGRRAELDTDFAVVEECNHYDECGDFTKVYGDAVLVIEYRRADFDKGCKAFPELSIVLRDQDLVTPAAKAYVYAGC
jgi:hypothetical protein